MSALEEIRARLQAKRELETVDLVVPSLEAEQVYLRFAPLVGFAKAQSYGPAAKARQKGKGSEWIVKANLQFLIDCCVGVFALVDGERYGFCEGTPTDPAEWPRFTEDALKIAEMLPEGADTSSAAAVMWSLYAAGYHPDSRGRADWDIVAHGTRVAELCGADAITRPLEELEGE